MPGCPKCGGKLSLVIFAPSGKVKVCKSCGYSVSMSKIDECNHQMDVCKYNFGGLIADEYSSLAPEVLWDRVRRFRLKK